MNREEAIKKLDQDIIDLVQKAWEEFPEIGVSYTGCVKYGHLRIRRAEHPDGIEFKLSDKQMDNLAYKDKVTFKSEDMISQIHYEEIAKMESKS